MARNYLGLALLLSGKRPMPTRERRGQAGCGRVLLVTVLISHLACCTWLDHATSASLQSELRERSKGGLALARWVPSTASVELRFFDGRRKILRLACCGSEAGVVVLRNRIAAVDKPSV